ncbi:membrane protein [Flavobacterium sp. 316]|uniref:Uncharacterized protein n=1 Tax=Flavobacterium sediminilitoris TaxID=2024526 RepID=A0ABY4HJT2_9FLAO|nr:hypothetical protein [Flavobacterium sp. 316]KIX22608.1 membrane protein [Flavobacterium sp. 316]UOX32916.1 hypothetical protein LXD69_12820 [Flavobacterium sediminilitoris]
MFSSGQLYFAVFFVIVFIFTMIYVYRKDLKQLQQQYKGTYWILFGFLLFIGLLFIIKVYLKE